MASDLDSQSLFAKSVATSPTRGARATLSVRFCCWVSGGKALPCQECVEATAEEGIKRLAGVFAR